MLYMKTNVSLWFSSVLCKSLQEWSESTYPVMCNNKVIDSLVGSAA
ncbi:hypothetical protein SAMN04488132_102296 [Sediminibacterium ginsengisoli]|uniref:Uncharacterized protein n=1 Tax=Sediminibacterium ginsengisoli TaxID=413434 RepID=A0A1T4L4V0_9BACT|nr:hypothetical protein SAMN04488132_102296 [Sediminibacterium ginsengisoli]